MITLDDLDIWRANYRNGTCTIEDHRRLYAAIHAEYPDQGYVNTSELFFFLKVHKPKTVVEIGGWDGWAAHNTMLAARVETWDNYEIAPVEPLPNMPTGYRHHTLEDAMPWETPGALSADALVASHVLEHLTAADLSRLLAALDVKAAYVDVPLLATTPTTWDGTWTTHALALSLEQFDQEWAARGWTLAHGVAYEHRNVHSYVRVYVR